MSLQEYVSCYVDKFANEKYRKEIKITKNGFIHMETGPHIVIDPKLFFNTPRIDHINFMELKTSNFCKDICMSDNEIIIKHFYVFYHFDLKVDTNVKLIHYIIGDNRKRKYKMYEDVENVGDAKIVEYDNDNDNENNDSLVRYKHIKYN